METSGVNPERPTYRGEFKQSVNLFEKSFHGMQNSTFDAQKEAHVKVMKQSLHIMQEASSQMFNQKINDLRDKLSSDFDEYVKEPTEERKAKIESDIQSLKHQA